MWNHAVLRTGARGRPQSHGSTPCSRSQRVDVVLVVLLGPQQPGERLAHDQRRVRAQRRRDHRRVEASASLAARVAPRASKPGPSGVAVRRGRRREAQPDRRARRRRASSSTWCAAHFVPVARRLDRVLRAVHDAGVDRRPSRAAVAFGAPNRRSLFVSFSQNSSARRRVARAAATRPARDARRARGHARRPSRPRSAGFGAPSPHDHVLRNHSVGSRCSVAVVGPAVVRADEHEDVVVRGLGVLDGHLEVAVLVEDRRCRGARTRSPACRGARSWPGGPRTGTPRCGYMYRHFRYECVGVESRWNQYSLASSPWLPSPFVRPNIRSLRIPAARPRGRCRPACCPRRSRCRCAGRRPGRPGRRACPCTGW